MSIVLRIVEQERPGGRLKRIAPKFRGNESERRPLSVETKIYDWLNVSSDSEAIQNIRAEARANCYAFVRGVEIDDCDFIKRVEDRRKVPPTFNAGVWALGIRLDPQHRLFGFFAIQNWFVVLSMQERSVLAEGDHRWHEQIDDCLRIWSELFPNDLPLVSDELRDYLSFNVEKCDDRW